MTGFLDDPVAPIHVRIETDVIGVFDGRAAAHQEIGRFQQRIDELLAQEFPALSVTFSQAMVGDPPEKEDETG